MAQGKQQEDLLEFGDMFMETELETLHPRPSVPEVLKILAEAGFKTDYTACAPKLPMNPRMSASFRDECRFCGEETSCYHRCRVLKKIDCELKYFSLTFLVNYCCGTYLWYGPVHGRRP